ncbi:MAG: hypothetical protein RLN62_04070 [Rickettsiales bacterium]
MSGVRHRVTEVAAGGGGRSDHVLGDRAADVPVQDCCQWFMSTVTAVFAFPNASEEVISKPSCVAGATAPKAYHGEPDGLGNFF